MQKAAINTLGGLLIAMLFIACADPVPKQAAPTALEQSQPMTTGVAEDRSGVVVETMNSGGYTYVHVDTGTEQFWAAAPEFEVEIGDPVVVPRGMPMENFHSETLDRDFDVVYFVNAVRVGADRPAEATLPRMPEGHPNVRTQTRSEVGNIDIEKVENGQRISEILANKAGFADKQVSIRAKVVKFNASIMGKNWLHVQDGTGEPGQNDLTVTTNAVARVGDTVVIHGVLATDKDFGFGYTYDVIVEDARVIVE